jgi:replicative DNA helicase
VAFIHREGYYNKTDPDVKNSATIIIGKQRNGPVGEVELVFESEFTKFSDKAAVKDNF